MIHHGDLFDVLPTLAADSIDACVTDGPYGIGFMGREWDTFKPGTGKARKLMHPREREAEKIVSDNPNIHGRHRSPALSPSQIDYDYSTAGLRRFQEWTEQWGHEVYRVLKPGAYVVSCGAPRSHHRMMCGLEDAGFVVRDCFAWLFGSGFPKNHNLGDGKGTALKPAHEPIALAWKPFKGPIKACHRTHGTAALNIDACRIDVTDRETYEANAPAGRGVPDSDRAESGFKMTNGSANDIGRWPANVLLDDEAAAILDAQTGELVSGPNPSRRGSDKFRDTYGEFKGQEECIPARGLDAGGASRFYKIVAPDCALCSASMDHRDTMNGCKTTPASNADRRSRTIHQIIAATALKSVADSLVEQYAHRAPFAGSLCEICEIRIVLALVETRHSDSKSAVSRVFRDSMPSSKSSILTLSLASFAALWANTDTIPTTASLSLLFGSVCHAIGSFIRPASLGSDSVPQRFLYSAKPSRKERDYGTEGLGERQRDDSRKAGNPGGDNPRNRGLQLRGNFHPTVKPVELMRWLVRLVAPIGGVVLDPFTGSGTTGMACRYEHRRFIGIEREADYVAIAERRIAAVAPLFSEGETA